MHAGVQPTRWNVGMLGCWYAGAEKVPRVCGRGRLVQWCALTACPCKAACMQACDARKQGHGLAPHPCTRASSLSVCWCAGMMAR
jgi:hypothetical protein